MKGLLLSALMLAAATPLCAADLDNVLFVQRFIPDGDAGQCGGSGERILSLATDWSPAIRIDTDKRSGSCLHGIGIVDIGNELPGLEISIGFFANGVPGQCGSPGVRAIPVSRKLNGAVLSDPMRYDTDGRPGGCEQAYSLKGRSDVALQVEFRPDGDAGQCGNFGTFLVQPGQNAQFRIDTDSRSGGCTLRYRLVAR